MADQVFAVNSGFYDAVNSDRTYSADDMNRPYKRVVSNGVFATPKGTKSTDLQVVSANNGMQIIVKKGEGIFADKWFENPTAINITVPANTSTVPRIDSVVVQVDKRTSGRVGNIVYRTGTPSVNPVAPSINTVSNVTEYRLANVRVETGTTAITTAMITDRRGSSDCPWVTSLIYQVDTSVLYDQWAAAYEEYFEAEKDMWDDWYSHLTEELDVSMTLVKRTNTFVTTQETSEITIGISDFNVNTDMLEVYINGMRAVEGSQYTINGNTSILLSAPLGVGQTVNFVVLKSIIMGNPDDIISIINDLEERIATIQGGNPTVVDNVSDMTDTDKIYILSTDGKWYYYSLTASEWTIGGIYGGVPTDTTLTESGMAADAKVVGDVIKSIDNTLDSISGDAYSTSLHLTANADNSSSYNRHLYAELPIESGKTYQLDFTFDECHFRTRSAGNPVFKVATSTSASYTHLVDTIVSIEESYSPETDNKSFTFTATANASHLYVYCYTYFNTAIDINIDVKEVRTFGEIDAIAEEVGESVFGLPISFTRSTTYDYSSTSMPLGTYHLTTGTYVLTYVQEEGALPTSLNSRCTPWCKTPNNENIFRKSNQVGVEKEGGDKYWVFNADTDGDYIFYFWYRLTILDNGDTTAHISNVELFKVGNVKGTLYQNVARGDAFEEIPYSYISQFQRIGCIGDSWTAGSIYETESIWAGTLGNLSWCKNAERFTGSQFIQFAKGGLSARTWLTDIHGKAAVENTDPCSLYIINLGINDASELTDSTITLGNVDDFENDVSGTFFYYYGAVVQCIKTHAPAAKIILETILIRSAQQVVVRNAIMEFASHYSIPCVDMYDDPFYRSSSVVLVGGHPTAGTHAGMAMANLRLFAKCIKDNPDYFKINTKCEFGDFSLLGIADSIGRNYISIPSFYSRPANTSHDSLSYPIGRTFLPKGKYIFKWTQSSATKIDTSSRCTPIYVFDGESEKHYYSGSNFSNSDSGTYRWVFETDTDSTLLWYYWSKYLVEDFSAFDFDLYAYDSIRGRMDKIEGLIE